MTSAEDNLLFILDAARWAPSGDNSQPWTFKIIDSDHVQVRLKSDRANPYEYRNGRPTLIAGGALIETMRIAASTRHRLCEIVNEYYDEPTDTRVIQLHLPQSDTVQPSPLFDVIETRSVNRYAFKTTPLDEATVRALEQALGPGYGIRWYTTFAERMQIVRINMMGTVIRFSIPETYPVHRDIVDWDDEKSVWGIPPLASGFSRINTHIMRWALQSWRRVRFLNRYLGASLSARLELDLIPGLRCARHFSMYIKSSTGDAQRPTSRQVLDAGAAMQRFWLTATKLGLDLQPSFQALIFGYYGATNMPFTVDKQQIKLAERIYLAAKDLWPQPVEAIFFQGRIGKKAPRKYPNVRSIRLPLEQLMEK